AYEIFHVTGVQTCALPIWDTGIGQILFGAIHDAILALLMNSAKEYLANSGIPEPEQGSESSLYNLAVMLYVALHYENRDPAARKIGRASGREGERVAESCG